MTLFDELQRIADRAPLADVPDDTWARARRARRRDLALATAGTVAVLALIAAAVAWLPAHREPPIAGTGSLGVPDHLYAVPDRMSSIQEDGSWAREEVTDDPTVIGVGAAAWVTDEGLPVVIDAKRGDYHLLDLSDLTPGTDSSVVALSPDGRDLAYGYADFGSDSETEPVPSGVRVVDLTTGDLREIPVPGKQGTIVSHIAWSPDGSWLAFTGRQQDVWTQTLSRADADGPVLGTIAPGAISATVRSTRDDVALAVDDAGRVSFEQVSLGQVWDDLYLARADNELQLHSEDESGYFTVGAVDPGVGDDLSVAVDLMTPGLPTVERPKPHWPWSEERISIAIGLGVAAAIAVFLGLRRLVRRYWPAR